jgi:hypothetical protein
MAAGTKRSNLQTATARRHSLSRKVKRFVHRLPGSLFSPHSKCERSTTQTLLPKDGPIIRSPVLTECLRWRTGSRARRALPPPHTATAQRGRCCGPCPKPETPNRHPGRSTTPTKLRTSGLCLTSQAAARPSRKRRSPHRQNTPAETKASQNGVRRGFRSPSQRPCSRRHDPTSRGPTGSLAV